MHRSHVCSRRQVRPRPDLGSKANGPRIGPNLAQGRPGMTSNSAADRPGIVRKATRKSRPRIGPRSILGRCRPQTDAKPTSERPNMMRARRQVGPTIEDIVRHDVDHCQHLGRVAAPKGHNEVAFSPGHPHSVYDMHSSDTSPGPRQGFSATECTMTCLSTSDPVGPCRPRQTTCDFGGS